MNFNLIYAERAVDYVKNTGRIRSGNQAEGVNRTPAQRGDVSQIVADGRRFGAGRISAAWSPRQRQRGEDACPARHAHQRRQLH